MRTDLNLSLLGPPRLEYCGVPINIPLTGSQAILYYLAHSNRAVSRQRLAGLLWPDRAEKDARRQLSYAVYRLGKALQDIGFENLVCSELSENLGLNPEFFSRFSVDSAELIALSSRLLNQPIEEQTARRFGEHLAEYQGEFLTGFSVPNSDMFENWQRGEAQYLQTLSSSAGLRLAEFYLQEHSFDKALQTARFVLRANPLDEAANRLAMQANMLIGNRAAAIQQYENLRHNLRETLGVDPSAETRSVYNDILQNRQGRFSRPDSSASMWRAVSRDDLFVGRNEEVQRITAGIQQALKGKVVWIAISGESGVGKTTLVENVLHSFDDLNCWIIKVQCFEATRDIPYLPIIDALRYIARESGMKLDQLQVQPVWRPVLAYLLPEFLPEDQDLQPLSPSGGPTQSLSFVRALIAVLEAIARHRPVIWLIDDAHWADESTLQMLTHLQGYDRFPLLLVLVFRDDPVEMSFEPFYTALLKLPQAICLPLKPLNPAEVDILIGPYFTASEALAALSKHLHQETRGNPLYLIEYMRAICEHIGTEKNMDPQAVLDLLGSKQSNMLITTGLQHFIRQRMARLSKPGRNMAEIAAVYGFRFKLKHVSTICDLDEDCLVDTMDELENLRVINSDGSDGYIFTHPLMHKVILSQMSTARARLLHQRVADIIERDFSLATSEQADILARHYMLGGVEEKACRYFILAAQRAVGLHAVEQSIDYYEQAQRLCTVNNPQQRVEVLMRLAETYKWKGDYRSAVQTCQVAISLCRDGIDPEIQGQCHLVLADIYTTSYNHDDALPMIDRGLELLPQAQYLSAARAYGLAVKGRALMQMRSAPEAPEPYLNEAIEIFEKVKDRHGLSRVLFDKAILNLNRGLYHPAVENIMQSLKLLEETRSDPVSLIMAYNAAAHFNLYMGRWQTAYNLGYHALDVATRSQNDEYTSRVLYTLGNIHLYRMEWQDAEDSFKHGLEIARKHQLERETCLNLCGLGDVYNLSKRNDLAAKMIAESMKHLERLEFWIFQTVHISAARAQLALGNTAAARQHLEHAWQIAFDFNFHIYKILCKQVQALIHAQSGQLERAVQQLEECAKDLKAVENEYHLVSLWLDLAAVLKEKDPDRSRGFSLQAHEMIQRGGL